MKRDIRQQIQRMVKMQNSAIFSTLERAAKMSIFEILNMVTARQNTFKLDFSGYTQICSLVSEIEQLRNARSCRYRVCGIQEPLIAFYEYIVAAFSNLQGDVGGSFLVNIQCFQKTSSTSSKRLGEKLRQYIHRRL